MNVYDKINQYGIYGLLEGTNRQSNGDTFFVDSTSGSNSAGGTWGEHWDTPYATVNYAVSKCTTGAGDVILVAAAHTETINSASTASGNTTGEFCIDKGDITILGMGRGTKRPTFTFTTANTVGVDIVGTSPNVTLANLLFIANYSDIATLVDVAANCFGLTIENCEFRDSSNSLESIIVISLAALIEDVTIRGCKFFNTNNGGCNSAIKTAGDADRLSIYDNWFRGDWNISPMDLNAAAIYDVLIRDNIINQYANDTGVVIHLDSSSTGAIVNNIIHTGLGATPIIADACLVSGNMISRTEGASAQPLAMLAGGGGTTSTMGTYYVDDRSGASDTNDGKSWESCFLTIQAAINACTNTNGDTIYVGAYFTDVIDGTTDKFDVDVPGLSIIGIGQAESRPIFSLVGSTTNSECLVSVANCRLENLIFEGAETSLVKLIGVTGDNCQIINCELRGDGTDEPLSAIELAGSGGAGDGLLVKGCTFDMVTGEADYGIKINNDVNGITVEDCTFKGEYDVGCVVLTATANTSLDLHIINNYMENIASGVPLVLISGVAVTGLIKDNIFVNDDWDNRCSPSKCMLVNNTWIDYAGTGGSVTTNNDPEATAEVFFIDSGAASAADAVGSGVSWDEPFLTLDYAIAQCTASQGATIHVAPGHAETIIDAAGIDIDVVGISIIGHGVGTDRPTITFDTGTDTSWVVQAANFYIENCIFKNTQDELVVGFAVSAAYCTFKNCLFIDDGSDNTIRWIIGTDAADWLTVIDCENVGASAAGNASFLEANGSTNLTIKNLTSNGNFSAANIETTNVACTDLLITGCHLENAHAIDVNIDMVAASTGWISYNSCRLLTDLQVTWIDPGNCAMFENYGVNDDGETGMICGTVSTNS